MIDRSRGPVVKTNCLHAKWLHAKWLAALLLIASSSAWSAGSDKPEPVFPEKTKMALKLAGLVTFVASSCPDLQPDYAKFKSAIGALGVSTADLEKVEMKGTYVSYMLRYKVNTAANCAKALKEFGPGGPVVADLVKPKAK